MESVELETLNNNTLMQYPKHNSYALPCDFVAVQGKCDFNWTMEDVTKMELDDKSLIKKMIPEKDTRENGASQKKYIQQTLNFGSDFFERVETQDGVVEAAVEATSKSQPNQSSDIESDNLAQNSHRCNLCDINVFGIPGVNRYRLCEYAGGCSKEKFICTVCGKPHAENARLHKHLVSHNPEKWYECEVCEKRFKMKNYLRQHLQSHAGKKYHCDICRRSYTYRSTLTRHMMLHIEGTEVNPYFRKSRDSEESSITKKSKQDDEEIIKPYECDVCGKRFEKKSRMQIHIEFLHVELFGDGPENLKGSSASLPSNKRLKLHKPFSNKRFQCRTCTKSYIHRGHLRRHEASHLPSALHSNVCGLCEQGFTTTSSLSRHMLNAHDVHHTSRKKIDLIKKRPSRDFQCKICDKAFTNLGDLRRHGAIHDARKPYECDTCKKQFAVKGYLYAHILTHDNWKPYPCESCGKIFKRKSSLQRHIDISHSDEKIHKCSICSKSFKFQSTYRIHMGRFHQSLNTKC